MNKFHRTSPLAGLLSYYPLFKLNGDERKLLRDYLENHLEGQENFQIIADFHFTKYDEESGKRDDVIVALCIEGGDWEEPLFFFLRRMNDELEILIPSERYQKRFKDVIEWLDVKDTNLLKPVHDYIDFCFHKKEFETPKWERIR